MLSLETPGQGDTEAARFDRMKVNVVHTPGGFSLEARRVVVLNVVGHRVECVEQAHLETNPRIEQPAGVGACALSRAGGGGRESWASAGSTPRTRMQNRRPARSFIRIRKGRGRMGDPSYYVSEVDSPPARRPAIRLVALPFPDIDSCRA